MKPLPDAAELRKRLVYDPETGILVWQKNPNKSKCFNTRYPGKPAGYIRPCCGRDYIIVSIDSIDYKAHRIIFAMMTGENPTQHIDHKDGDGTNNRWENLRPATAPQNLQNVLRRRTNTSGFKGVTRRGNRWHARIGAKWTSLGTFATPEEAYAAYCKAAKEQFGEFFNPG